MKHNTIMGDAILDGLTTVTKTWAKQRKKEERETSAILNRRHAMTQVQQTSQTDAAWDIMEDAYRKVSANGSLPAHARQIMYAARPYIQDAVDRELGKNFDQYFTQTLLPDYMQAHPSETAGWNVVFDARGTFHEPHTEEGVPLGTLQVRDYLARIEQHQVEGLDFNVWEKHYPTLGPEHRYGAALFIEKEGFRPLFEQVKLAERYDLAIMSTKGMTVTASRELVDRLCGAHDIPLYVLHDFDKAGFSIVGSFRRNTKRYRFQHRINVVDLGMRLADIDGLEAERVSLPASAKWNLRKNGATSEEIDFLLEQRVELNAFASDELVAWIEGKLEEHGVAKVIPDEDSLADAYRRAKQQAFVQGKIDDVLDEAHDLGEHAEIPDDLADKVALRLKKDSTLPWDTVVRQIAEKAERGD